MCKTEDTQYFIMKLTEWIYLYTTDDYICAFEVFWYRMYTRTFVMLIVTCKGHCDSSVFTHYNMTSIVGCDVKPNSVY